MSDYYAWLEDAIRASQSHGEERVGVNDVESKVMVLKTNLLIGSATTVY